MREHDNDSKYFLWGTVLLETNPCRFPLYIFPRHHAGTSRPAWHWALDCCHIDVLMMSSRVTFQQCEDHARQHVVAMYSQFHNFKMQTRNTLSPAMMTCTTRPFLSWSNINALFNLGGPAPLDSTSQAAALQYSTVLPSRNLSDTCTLAELIGAMIRSLLQLQVHCSLLAY